jgi:hypothetical protein
MFSILAPTPSIQPTSAIASARTDLQICLQHREEGKERHFFNQAKERRLDKVDARCLRNQSRTTAHSVRQSSSSGDELVLSQTQIDVKRTKLERLLQKNGSLKKLVGWFPKQKKALHTWQRNSSVKHNDPLFCRR